MTLILDPTDTPYRVYPRDESLLLGPEIDAYTEFECERVFNDVGSWSMRLPSDAPGASYLSEVGNRRGVVVLDSDGHVVFSGPLTEMRRTGDGVGDVLELLGACDNALLARRAARPDPAGPPYDTQSHDVRTGTADAVMAEYVDATMGAVATALGWPERTVPGLIIPSPSGLGSVVTGRARFDNLLELLQDLAAAGGGLRFEIIQYDLVNGLIQFVVTRPTDKSTTVVFDPDSGSLATRTHTERAPSVTFAIAGGEGEDTQRIVTEQGDSTAISRYGLRETFLDARDTSETGVLGQRIAEALEQGREDVSVEVDALDTAQIAFGTTYGLGDIVAIRAAGVETVGYVAAVTLTITRERASEGGVSMLRPTIQTLGVVRQSAGGEGGGRAGGLAGWLSRNAEGETPGTVKAWAGTVAEIPPRYQLMDGTAGTTDMQGKFLVGADGDAGGPTTYPLFGTGGAASYGAALAHNHGPGTLAIAHTHGVGSIAIAHDHGPGTLSLPHRHDHGHAIPDHQHTVPDHGHSIPDHNHTYDLTHDHPNQGSAAGVSGEATNSVQSGAGATVNPTNHTHPVNLTNFSMPGQGTSNQSSGGSNTNNKTGLSTNDKTGLVATTTSGTTMDISSTQTASGATGAAQNAVASGSTGAVASPSSSGTTADALTTMSIPTVSPYRALLLIQRVAVS